MLGLLGDKYWQLLDGGQQIIDVQLQSHIVQHFREATLRARIQRRRAEGHDASEADLAVLDHRLKTREPLAPHEQAVALRWDTESPAEDVTIAADLERLVRPPGNANVQASGHR